MNGPGGTVTGVGALPASWTVGVVPGPGLVAVYHGVVLVGSEECLPVLPDLRSAAEGGGDPWELAERLIQALEPWGAVPITGLVPGDHGVTRLECRQGAWRQWDEEAHPVRAGAPGAVPDWSELRSGTVTGSGAVLTRSVLAAAQPGNEAASTRATPATPPARPPAPLVPLPAALLSDVPEVPLRGATPTAPLMAVLPDGTRLPLADLLARLDPATGSRDRPTVRQFVVEVGPA